LIDTISSLAAFSDRGLQPLARIAQLALDLLGRLITVAPCRFGVRLRRADVGEQHEEQRIGLVVAERLDREPGELHAVVHLDRDALAHRRAARLHGFLEGAAQFQAQPAARRGEQLPARHARRRLEVASGA
jgi:hypothetical protein